MLYAGPIVPASVKDYHFASGRQMRHIRYLYFFEVFQLLMVPNLYHRRMGFGGLTFYLWTVAYSKNAMKSYGWILSFLTNRPLFFCTLFN